MHNLISRELCITQILCILVNLHNNYASCIDWDNLDMPPLNLNYTTGAYERNFSKYFHHNTMPLDVKKLNELKDMDPWANATSAENLALARETEQKNKMGHCIFDDFFDMRTFRMKPKVEEEFLLQMKDICSIRVEQTEQLFLRISQEKLTQEDVTQQYEYIKLQCDRNVEDFCVRVLTSYKEEVKLAASHHYDLRPQDAARIKYEERIDNHFMKLGFEFLPIIETQYDMCSKKYYERYHVYPSCDSNTEIKEEDKKKYHDKIDRARDEVYNTTAI